jgi:hypothetical protein
MTHVVKHLLAISGYSNQVAFMDLPTCTYLANAGQFFGHPPTNISCASPLTTLRRLERRHFYQSLSFPGTNDAHAVASGMFIRFPWQQIT